MKRLFLICTAVLLLLSGCGKKESTETAAAPEQTERRRAEESSDSAWARALPAASPESSRLLRQTKYDAAGSVVSWTDYTLNADGRPIKSVPHSAGGFLTDEDFLCSYEYSNGYLTARNDYSGDGQRLISRRKYDAAGHELKWILYDEDGKVNLWYENTYNEQGDCISHLLCREGEKPKVMNLREYDYDENGHISQCRYLSQSGSVIHIYDYSYEPDAQGRVLSYRQYDSSARLLVEWFRYGYDENGRVAVEEQLDAGERVLIRREYLYDAQGRVDRELLYSSDGNLAVVLENSWE